KTDAVVSLTANAFAKEGYTFAGWATTATGEVAYADGVDFKVTASGATLYAKWTINTYTVNFNYDGADSDTSVQTMQTTYGATFACPMPTKTDYVFQGWYNGETQITDNLGASIVTLTGENDKVFNFKAKWALQIEGMAISGTTLTQYTGTAKYVVIPDSVTSIGNSAFSGCSGLTSITIPASVETINAEAFWNCYNLTSVVFEKNSKLTSIGGRAFFNSKIKEFSLPASVTTLVYDSGYSSFMGSHIEKFIVEEGNTTFYVDGNCLINKSTQTLIAGCKDSVIPTDGSVTSIEQHAFFNCIGLTSIIIPSSVKSIGQ
ncbi:MAG: leucine-rich repeat protein, partial [Clostridia bacterium]